MLRSIENLGRFTIRSIEELGYAISLAFVSLKWLLLGKSKKQPVQLVTIAEEIVTIGVHAIPIVSVLCFAVGVMLAIQGIDTLKTFGAEHKVVLGIALSIPREFSPLIVGILVAGRSGSAITARIGTMVESQEIDALRVIGINPNRYITAPLLIAMMISVPLLTILGDFMGVIGGGVFASIELGMNMDAYLTRTLDILVPYDIFQGLIKSVIFAYIIAVVGVSNGFQVRGGAAGVGKATTRSVVMSISYIVVTDMIFTYFLNR
ncbi:MAG: ABC transporter permease [Gammaproteobacteria bacterium]|nr:ABC transporter permease [Gammaproteobacteria bacterium]